MGSGGLICGGNRSALSNLQLFLRKSSERRAFTRTSCSKIDPPDLTRLAQTARISLTPNQVEEFAPKIRQVVDWFGQLQAVDLDSVEPSIRADTDYDNLRSDIPQTFDNREAIIGGIPKYEEPYIRVPKVLSDE